MTMGCSVTQIIKREHPAQGIRDIAKAGFGSVFLDFSIYCSEYELENAEKCEQQGNSWNGVVTEPLKLHKAARELYELCQAQGLLIALAKAPGLMAGTKRCDLNQRLYELAQESILCCAKIGCKYLIVPSLFAGIAQNEIWNVNRKYYLSLAETAKKQGIVLLLENQCRSVNGKLGRGICADAYEAREWIDELNRQTGWEGFGFCLDTGVCTLCGQSMAEMTGILGNRIKAVILRDCDGICESAQLPFTCAKQRISQTDWQSLIRGLRKLEYEGLLMLDMQDTAAAFSPILRPQLLSLAYSTVLFLKWQISLEYTISKHRHVVLFGAGNMCRNYMQAYGKKYPPLFTCDNNQQLWGSRICGLEVKPPEALRELPEDCGVLICNIYYREIEQQLRDMGVRNIEYFNDEYLDTFSVDKADG